MLLPWIKLWFLLLGMLTFPSPPTTTPPEYINRFWLSKGAKYRFSISKQFAQPYFVVSPPKEGCRQVLSDLEDTLASLSWNNSECYPNMVPACKYWHFSTAQPSPLLHRCYYTQSEIVSFCAKSASLWMHPPCSSAWAQAVDARNRPSPHAFHRAAPRDHPSPQLSQFCFQTWYSGHTPPLHTSSTEGRGSPVESRCWYDNPASHGAPRHSQ